MGQYAAEVVFAYPIGLIAVFVWAFALSALSHPLVGSALDKSWLSRALGPPSLAGFWLTAAVIAWLVFRRARSRPTSVFAAGRAGEWVWVLGAVYIVAAFFTYAPIGKGWVHDALFELFAATDDIGNFATAPFYMGIACSLTRHFLRLREERLQRLGAAAVLGL